MSKSPPPKPNGSCPAPEPDPESGSFLRLSRSLSSPDEKPKGRSDMPSTVLTTEGSCGPGGHALSEPAQTAVYCCWREQADFYAAGRPGADRGVRRAARDGDGPIRFAWPRPDLQHPRRGRG